MQNTTNYNFNLPEGTDLWNYLTQTNPNFTALDSILKGISDATVTTATEVASGTAHAISRTLPDANVIRFTATSNWTLGDTMTIDGTPVTVVKPNGTNLQTGDYVIGSEVLGVIRATQFTVYVGGASVDAGDVTFDNDNTHAWLTASDVEDAIKETATEVDTINSNLPHLQATANANQTFALQLAQLKTTYDTLTENQKLNAYILRGNGTKYSVADITAGIFVSPAVYGTLGGIWCMTLSDTTYRNMQYTNGSTTITDISSNNDIQPLYLYA